MQGQVEFLGSFPGALPELSLPEIAFAGRSNVGKSSALNQLLGMKKAARVSQTPGRTQMINLFKVRDRMIFADLPGYGYAKVPDAVRESWGPMIETYLGERSTLKLVVVLVDVRRDPMESDGQLLDGLRDAGVPFLVVATKCDKLKKQARSKQLQLIRQTFELPPGQPVAFSSVTGDGRREVWAALDEAIR